LSSNINKKVNFIKKNGMLGIAILNSTSKNTLSSLLCLFLFFNKISDKGRTDLPGIEGGRGRGWGEGQGGEMTQTMYAHMNK
jgi:hypothetical protein